MQINNYIKKGGEIYISIFSMRENTIGMLFIILPLLTFLISLIAQLLIKKKIIIIIIVFILYLKVLSNPNNSGYMMWCYIYTFISLLATLLSDLILKYKKRLAK